MPQTSMISFFFDPGQSLAYPFNILLPKSAGLDFPSFSMPGLRTSPVTYRLHSIEVGTDPTLPEDLKFVVEVSDGGNKPFVTRDVTHEIILASGDYLAEIVLEEAIMLNTGDRFALNFSTLGGQPDRDVYIHGHIYLNPA